MRKESKLKSIKCREKEKTGTLHPDRETCEAIRGPDITNLIVLLLNTLGLKTTASSDRTVNRLQTVLHRKKAADLIKGEQNQGVTHRKLLYPQQIQFLDKATQTRALKKRNCGSYANTQTSSSTMHTYRKNREEQACERMLLPRDFPLSWKCS